jgi:hypothetical protein
VTRRGPFQAALAPLREIPHVLGAFAMSELGRLLARDLSALFDSEVLRQVGPRALRLCETFRTGSENVRLCRLRYGQHQLFLQPMRDGLLCVLASAAVNHLTVRRGMNLAIRHLHSALDGPVTAWNTPTVLRAPR